MYPFTREMSELSQRVYFKSKNRRRRKGREGGGKKVKQPRQKQKDEKIS